MKRVYDYDTIWSYILFLVFCIVWSLGIYYEIITFH